MPICGEYLVILGNFALHLLNYYAPCSVDTFQEAFERGYPGRKWFLDQTNIFLLLRYAVRTTGAASPWEAGRVPWKVLVEFGLRRMGQAGAVRLDHGYIFEDLGRLLEFKKSRPRIRVM